jgi:hypothetical protein
MGQWMHTAQTMPTTLLMPADLDLTTSADQAENILPFIKQNRALKTLFGEKLRYFRRITLWPSLSDKINREELLDGINALRYLGYPCRLQKKGNGL